MGTITIEFSDGTEASWTFTDDEAEVIAEVIEQVTGVKANIKT